MAHNLRSKDKGMKEGDEEITLDPVQATQIRIMMKAAEKEEQRREQAVERAVRRAEEATAEEVRWKFKLMEEDMRERREADIQLRSQNNNAQQGDHTASIIRRISPMLGMFPMDPREIAAYFQRIEGIFDSHRAHEETYPVFASRLHRNLRFYLQSRKVETLDQALSLLVVDRMKELLPKNLLEHALAQEGEEWLTHERLANVVEIYEANMNMRLSSNVVPGYKPLQTAVRPGTDPKWLNKEVVKRSISKVTAMSQATKELKKPSITPGTIQAEKYFKKPFVQVKIQAGPTCASLVDSGAEVCGISQDLCHKLNIPRGERLRIKGWNGPTTEVDGAWVMMAYNPDEDESIAPAVRVWCAVVPNASEQLIITPKVVELLKMADQYVVPAVKLEMTKNITPIKLGNESTLTFYNPDSLQIPCQERCGRSDRRDDVDAAKRRVSENDDKCNDESIVRSHEDSTLLSSEEVETVSARTWSQHWQEKFCTLTSNFCFYFGFPY
ncbi:hypothetical protein HELRODRAFT_162828 [Helobdella robusta]|uniref:Uncharacterized protein n=1 Tax=Helobdella robusta TaxID=6412 RepID=T1ET83_HELRO|nr:hypothetical protein HELRODRAFT_162828 [Helobdella robusta]ESN99308.1 hypothetical protein HELRODRAFT_162828 [Helobdella robusta]